MLNKAKNIFEIINIYIFAYHFIVSIFNIYILLSMYGQFVTIHEQKNNIQEISLLANNFEFNFI